MDPGFTTKDPDKRCQTEKKNVFSSRPKEKWQIFNTQSSYHNSAIVDGI